MYGGLLLLAAAALLMLSPFIWVAWWLLADLGEKASGRTTTSPQRRPVYNLPRAA